MATCYHNLSDYNPETVPSAAGMRFGIVVSEWNPSITNALCEGAVKTLVDNGAAEADITVMSVPGSFELIYGAARMVHAAQVDAVIAIGCVVKGDTPHFDYICQGATQGLAQLNTLGTVPVIYGLLTCNEMEQAEARAGGNLGNKGDECAITAIKMADYARRLKK